MLLKALILALSSLVGGVGALHVSVLFESYVLLTAAMALLAAGTGVLVSAAPRGAAAA